MRAVDSTDITFMIETGFAYLRNILAKVEVKVKDNTKIMNSICWEYITDKQFN